MSRVAIPCPSNGWALAQSEYKRNERRVIVIDGPVLSDSYYLGINILEQRVGRSGGILGYSDEPPEETTSLYRLFSASSLVASCLAFASLFSKSGISL